MVKHVSRCLVHPDPLLISSQAVAKARSNPKYDQLFRSVRGIAFFATPHWGGLAAKLETRIMTSSSLA